MDKTIITLDLRGTIFKTHKKTFDKMILFAADASMTGENEYFVDKDPKYFNLILDYAKAEDSLLPKSLQLIQSSVAVYEKDNLLYEIQSYGLCTCSYTNYRMEKYEPSCKKHKTKLTEHLKICRNGSNHLNGYMSPCVWWI